MTEQTFIKINAVVGRADDDVITIKELDEFEANFVEWLDQRGYVTCAIWELITEPSDTDFTRLVGFFELDGSILPAYERRADD